MYNSRLQRSITIKRPIEDVFAFVSNSENRPEWMHVTEVKKLTKGPIGVGTTFSSVVDTPERRWESTLEVVEYQPGERYAFRAESPVPLQLDHLFKPVAGGTRVTLRLEAEYTGVSRLARPFVNLATRRQMHVDLVALKKCLEGRAD
jgi:uncharacterized protein YndB with AHSA1/START domain